MCTRSLEQNCPVYQTERKSLPAWGSARKEIVNSCVHNLTWTHFRSLLRVSDEGARVWYMSESAHENWNVRMLDRNISTQ